MKNLFKFLLIVGVASLSFIACTENNVEKSTQNVDKKVTYTSDPFPDDTYFIEGPPAVELTFVDNKLVDRKVDGKNVDLSLAPKQTVFYGSGAQNSAMSLYDKLDELGMPCIKASRAKSNNSQTIWVVEYDNIVPCWYE